jgi:hypothetical protein
MAQCARSGFRRALHQRDDAVAGGDRSHHVGERPDACGARRVSDRLPFQVVRIAKRIYNLAAECRPSAIKPLGADFDQRDAGVADAAETDARQIDRLAP